MSTLNDKKNMENDNKTNIQYDEYLICRELVVHTQEASIALLQRYFKMEYDKAEKIIHYLEADGIIGPENGFKPREVFIKSLEELEYITKNNLNSSQFINKDSIHSLSGLEFENLTGIILKHNGFQDITVTKASGDYGVDIIAFKDEIKYAIQCKKYSSPVGVKAVQEVIGSKAMNNCHVAVVLTNHTFTDNAHELAQANNVLLWDGKKLLEMINNIETADKLKISEMMTNSIMSIDLSKLNDKKNEQRYTKITKQTNSDSFDDEDEEYEMCREFVIETQKASTSILQRKFRIGYNKAARIIDQLEEDGVIGPPLKNNIREVYIRKYFEDDLNNDNNSSTNVKQNNSAVIKKLIISIPNIIRGGIGILFILSGLFSMSDETLSDMFMFSFFMTLFGISLIPTLYTTLFAKVNSRKLQIILPVLMFIALMVACI